MTEGGYFVSDFEILAKYVELHPSEVFPYRLLSEAEGLVYRYDLAEVLTIVVSQLIEGRTVVVMPPERPAVDVLREVAD